MWKYFRARSIVQAQHGLVMPGKEIEEASQGVWDMYTSFSGVYPNNA